MDEDIIEKNMQVSKFAQSFTTFGYTDKTKEITTSISNSDISDNQIINQKYFKITDSTGVYTYEEMKEKCKKMNWIISFIV